MPPHLDGNHQKIFTLFSRGEPPFPSLAQKSPAQLTTLFFEFLLRSDGSAPPDCFNEAERQGIALRSVQLTGPEHDVPVFFNALFLRLSFFFCSLENRRPL